MSPGPDAGRRACHSTVAGRTGWPSVGGYWWSVPAARATVFAPVRVAGKHEAHTARWQVGQHVRRVGEQQRPCTERHRAERSAEIVPSAVRIVDARQPEGGAVPVEPSSRVAQHLHALTRRATINASVSTDNPDRNSRDCPGSRTSRAVPETRLAVRHTRRSRCYRGRGRQSPR